MNKLILLTISLMLPNIVHAEYVEDIENFRLTFQKHEVVTDQNGLEIIYPTSTLLPEIVFEEHIKFKNKEDKSFKKFAYIYKIGIDSFFIKQPKRSSNIDFTYSSDGVKYHEVLNKKNDIYLKFTINDISSYYEDLLKIRFKYSIYEE